MFYFLPVVLYGLLWSFNIRTVLGAPSAAFGDIMVQCPQVVIGKLPFSISLTFPLQGPEHHRAWENEYFYQVSIVHLSSSIEAVISSGNVSSPIKNEKILADISNFRDDYLKASFLDQYKVTIDNLSFSSVPLDKFYGSFKFKVRLSNTPFIEDKSSSAKNTEYHYYSEEYSFCIPAWLSILPSILTVILAIALKQSLLAIFSGCWLGTTLLYGGNPLIGLLRTLDTTLIHGMSAPDHACVLLFCLFIGGMIGVLGVGGGASGLAMVVTKFAKTRQRAAFATYLIGILTFFDDYASCLISGLTMKDITGLMKISREKLSFISDTCAANISAISIVSSWICIEISYIIQEYAELGMETDGYSTFVRALPYNFYPISMLVFCLLGIIINRDFGPMLTAERRAHRTGQLVKPGSQPLAGGSEVDGNSFFTPKKGVKCLWWNAAIPFFMVIAIVLASMLGDGAYTLSSYRAFLFEKSSMAKINNLPNLQNRLLLEIQKLDSSWGPSSWIAASVPFNGLLWASILASATAIILVVSQRILTLSESMDAWMNGAKSMLFAVLILIMAWGLGDVCHKLKAAEWITSCIKSTLSAHFFPTLVFITASAVSFATGSAWGTMSILFPLMIQMAYSLQISLDPSSDPATSTCLYATVASILGGAVWGNQSSPIADSCIMSSIASGADHNDHVSTQLGYTIPVGAISILFGYLPVCFGIYSWPVAYCFKIIIFISLFYAIGGQSDADDERNDPYLCKYFSVAPPECKVTGA